MARIRELTGGRGVDDAFEVVGLSETLRQAYECLAKRGVAMLVGVSPTTAEVTLPTLPLVYEERVLTRSCPIEEINEAYDALQSGETFRSVVTF